MLLKPPKSLTIGSIYSYEVTVITFNFNNFKVPDKWVPLNLLKVFKKLKADERSHIIPYLKNDAIEFLCECFHNVLYTDIGIKNKHFPKQSRRY